MNLEAAIMFLLLIWLATFFVAFSHWLIWMYCFDEPNKTDLKIDNEMNKFCEDLLTSVREMKSGTIHLSFSRDSGKSND